MMADALGVVGFILKVVGAGVIAAALHELTHYVVARLGGREAWIEWAALNVRHVYPLSGPALIDRLVGVAPFAVGSVFGVSWLAVSLPISPALVVAWGVYTLGGVPNDFRI